MVSAQFSSRWTIACRAGWCKWYNNASHKLLVALICITVFYRRPPILNPQFWLLLALIHSFLHYFFTDRYFWPIWRFGFLLPWMFLNASVSDTVPDWSDTETRVASLIKVSASGIIYHTSFNMKSLSEANSLSISLFIRSYSSHDPLSKIVTRCHNVSKSFLSKLSVEDFLLSTLTHVFASLAKLLN